MREKYTYEEKEIMLKQLSKYINEVIKDFSIKLKRKETKYYSRHIFCGEYLDNFYDPFYESEEISLNVNFVEEILSNQEYYNIVKQFNNRQKEIFYLIAVKDMSEEEIAIKLKVSRQAVNKNKNFAIRNFIKKLTQNN